MLIEAGSRKAIKKKKENKSINPKSPRYTLEFSRVLFLEFLTLSRLKCFFNRLRFEVLI